MLASLLGGLPLACSLVALVALVGPPVTLRHAERAFEAPAIVPPAIDLGRGVTHAVDGTLVDPGDSRPAGSDRHAPRNDRLPLPVALAILAGALMRRGGVAGRSVGPGAITWLRGSIGRRAPPALAAS